MSSSVFARTNSFRARARRSRWPAGMRSAGIAQPIPTAAERGLRPATKTVFRPHLDPRGHRLASRALAAFCGAPWGGGGGGGGGGVGLIERMVMPSLLNPDLRCPDFFNTRSLDLSTTSPGQFFIQIC